MELDDAAKAQIDELMIVLRENLVLLEATLLHNALDPGTEERLTAHLQIALRRINATIECLRQTSPMVKVTENDWLSLPSAGHLRSPIK